jgi:hypothetical protein
MNSLKSIYCLKEDYRRIKIIQEASIDEKSIYGYKIENGLLFGTKEWFDAIEDGIIIKHSIKGIITRIFMSGHNDYPEFEIENSEGKTIWPKFGCDDAYKVGKKIELVFVEQKYKRPNDIIGPISKCVIEIKNSE